MEINLFQIKLQILLMKRTSLHQINTVLQQPRDLQPSKTPLQKHENLIISVGEASLKLQEGKTEKPLVSILPPQLFGNCFPSSSSSIQTSKPYHKLQYRSLDKDSKKVNKKISGQNKSTESKVFSDFQTKNSRQKNGSFDRPTSNFQGSLPSTITSERNGKYNDCSSHLDQYQTKLSSQVPILFNFLCQQSATHKLDSKQKMFLSEDLRSDKNQSFSKQKNKKNPNLRKYSEQVDKNLLSTIHCRDQSDSFQSSVNPWNAFNTFDSYKIKGSIQTGQQQTETHLSSLHTKLCQSIKINKQNITDSDATQNAFQFNALEDSLIDKLDIFKKQNRLMSGKRKSFLRRNHQKAQNNRSPMFVYQGFQQNKLRTQASQQNQQQNETQTKFHSKQTIQENINRKRFRYLDQCACTIVSNYNKSSERKSVLQESNIIFQASKMHDNEQINNQKLPTFSDSQVVFTQINQNNQNNKPYSSFIQQINSEKQIDAPMRNSDEIFFIDRKIKCKFLRSSDKKSPLPQNQQSVEMEIRFDLDTFIQYGPI